MIVIEDLLAETWKLPACIAGIGSFDGVHLAHQQLIEAVVARARELALPSAILLFDPLPKAILRPGFTGTLTSLERKLGLIAELGPDHACVIRFSLEFAHMGPRSFVENVLRGRMGAREVFVGFNFSFGEGARGTPGMLERLGYDAGFRTHVLPPVKQGDRLISSSSIRDMLKEGDVEGAARMLGRSYRLDGAVVPGDGRARGLGFPTANLQAEPTSAMVPANGVYCGTAQTGTLERPCVVYIGTSPTFGGLVRKVEVHLLDWSGDLQGRVLSVHFARRIRAERRFESTEELIEQLGRDIAESRVPTARPQATVPFWRVEDPARDSKGRLPAREGPP
ncbi:MAG: riboflavin biosynthesis protein RibF [Candidatus Riflebacteria bacterium]|nr:riboflavin biosynthesis protein RibF [Candidatus Riflebacteria bacterium]